MMRMDADASTLVLVDYQERLLPALTQGEAALNTAMTLTRAARLLAIPVLGTEQSPAGLGPNVPGIRNACDHTLAKTCFDACADGLCTQLDAIAPGRKDTVIAGCEAHVCLLQTALGLLRAGRRVWVVEDACASRRPRDHAAAMRRLAQAGATIVTHEMVLFEWLHASTHARFREVLALVKAAG